MATSIEENLRRNNPSLHAFVIFISASARSWRWRATLDGRSVAGGSGLFPRAVDQRYALRFAELKAQAWCLKNQIVGFRVEVAA
jgi:hypothetical protein